MEPDSPQFISTRSHFTSTSWPVTLSPSCPIPASVLSSKPVLYSHLDCWLTHSHIQLSALCVRPSNPIGAVCASPLAKMPIYMVGIHFQSHVQVVRLDFTNYLLQTPPTPTIFKPDLTSIGIQSWRTDRPGRGSLKNTCNGMICNSYKQAVVTERRGWTGDSDWTAYLVCHRVSYDFLWLTRLRDPRGTAYLF